ncbi:MAG: S8 family peptidase [Lachnospiraceae bacterium]|nr:S8 family peptidase [Lachnospiraceae bacterium]
MDCKEKILSEEYADGVVDFPVERVVREGDDVCYIRLNGRYYVAYQNRQAAPDLFGSTLQYQYTPKLYGLMQIEEDVRPDTIFDPSSLISSGIRQLQGQPLNLRGQGVIIAIIDTGIDYRNPAFLDANGESRILAIWDQTVQEGTAPEGLYFGSEYSREDINLALNSEKPLEIVPVTDPLRHGTVMAGIAAGSIVGGGSEYIGAAPEADIVIVKLKESKQYLKEYYFIPEGVPAYEENDIMLGIAYANRFAEDFRRPVVICLGVGTNMGDHAGNSFLGRYMNDVALQRSRAIVVCGGNEGIANHHYTWQFPMREEEQVAYRDVEVRVGEGERGFLMEFWGSVPDIFNISVRSPGGETIPPLRLGVEQRDTYRFIFEDTVVTIQSVLVEAGAGEEFIRFRFQAPTPGIWTIRVTTLGEIHNGVFHMWLPITQFLSSTTFFLEASPDTTITEPAMASEVICVTNYNHVNNSFYLESGRGFSRTGQIRPDFAAPGVNVPTLYGNRTGSSLSAAITAGGVAQFMQWAVVEGNSPLAESREIRNYFIKGAVRLPELTYPNREWGYGALNVLGAFEKLRGDV